MPFSKVGNVVFYIDVTLGAEESGRDEPVMFEILFSPAKPVPAPVHPDKKERNDQIGGIVQAGCTVRGIEGQGRTQKADQKKRRQRQKHAAEQFRQPLSECLRHREKTVEKTIHAAPPGEIPVPLRYTITQEREKRKPEAGKKRRKAVRLPPLRSIRALRSSSVPTGQPSSTFLRRRARRGRPR